MSVELPKEELQAAVLRLLSSSLMLHIAHIASKSLPRHQALERAYETLQGSADLLGEISLGVDGSMILQEFSSLDAVSELKSCVNHLLLLSKKIEDGPMKALVEDQISKLRHEIFLLQQTNG